MVDILNAFAQTVVSEEDAEHRVIVRIRGQPLVDILVSIAPDVYGPYVSTNKSGQKVLIVECLNAVYVGWDVGIVAITKLEEQVAITKLREQVAIKKLGEQVAITKLGEQVAGNTKLKWWSFIYFSP